jgi:cobyrinic acid a,c-diamide synthase
VTLPRLLVAAPSRGSGKSTVAIGLAAALRARGRTVQTFKKGPDFIDPMWLSAASGRRCRNLDFFMMGRERIAACFPARAAGADLALVEANHGLHDGPDPAGSDSGAALATLLGLPVLLVVNAQRLGRGVAPLVQGQIAFDPAVSIAGVVLNRVRGARHEGKLRDAIERYCRVEVLGVLPDLPELAITERHLGLTPLAEVPDLEPLVDRIGAAVAQHLDLEKIEAAANAAGNLPGEPPDTGSAEGGRGAGAPGGAQRLASTDGGAQRPDPAVRTGKFQASSYWR